MYGSMGLSSGGQCPFGVSVPEGGVLRSTISGHRIESGASGSTSPLYFSKEVHMILRDFVSEPIQEGGFSAQTPVFLGSGGLFPGLASGGADSVPHGSGAISSANLFVSRVLADPVVSKGGGSSDSSFVGYSDGSRTSKKKQKSVRPKKLLRLAIGDGVSMAEAPSFADRALVGHARGRNLSVGFLKRWLDLNWSGKVQTLPQVIQR